MAIGTHNDPSIFAGSWVVKNSDTQGLLGKCRNIMLVADQDFVIRSVKAHREKAKDIRQDTFVGKRLRDIFSDDMEMALKEHYHTIRHKEELVFLTCEIDLEDDCCHYEVQLLPYDEENISIVLRDISYKNNIQRELQDSHERFRTIFDNTYHSMVLLDTTGKILQANSRFRDLIRKEEGRVPENIFELDGTSVTGINAELLKEPLEKAKRGEAVLQLESHTRAGGQDRYSDISLKPVLEEGGKVRQLVMEARDVTESKRLELELRQQYRMYKQLADHIPKGAILVLDKDLRYSFISGPALADLAYTEERMIGKTPKEALPEVNYKAVKNAYKDALEKGELTLLEVRSYNDRWYRTNIGPLRNTEGDISGVISVFYDVTDLKGLQAELESKLTQLEASEHLYQTLVKHIPKGAVLQFDENAVFTMAEGSIFGNGGAVPREAFIGRGIKEIAGEGQWPLLKSKIEQVLSGSTVNLEIRSPFTMKTFAITCTPLYKGGKVKGGIALCLDIQQLKDMEKELFQKEMLYRELARTLPDGAILMFDHTLRCSLCEGTALSKFNMQVFDPDHCNLSEILMPADFETLKPIFQKALEGENSSSEILSHNNNWFRVNTIPVRNKEGGIDGGIAVIFDIQKLKATELELQTKIVAIEKSEKIYRTVAENIPMGSLLLFDKDTRFTLAEGPGLQMAGYKKEDYIGKTPGEILPPDTAEKMMVYYQKVLEGESVTFEWQAKASERYISISMAPVYDAEGNVDGGIVVSFDIQHLKDVEAALEEKLQALKYSESLYRTLAQKIPNAVLIMFDKELRFTLVEGEVLKEIGYSKETMEGRLLRELVPRETFLLQSGLYQRALEGETVTQETRATSGREFLSTYFPIRDQKGQITGGMAVAFDIHHLKQTERELESKLEELRQLNEKLNKEIKIRSLVEENLKQYADELKLKNQELEQFAYVASHDLQEPLRMIASFAQLLARKYEGTLDSDGNTFIEFIIEGAHRMQSLINDLLAYSRVDSRARPPAEVNVKEVLDVVLNTLSIKIDETGTEIRAGEMPTLKADRSQLVQLFQNLITNAIKFVKPGHTPLIIINAEDRGKEWLFSFSDNGIGINEEHRERIFQIFQRLHSREKYEGTGIGLAICKKIVERHGGEIWVESEAGEGSTFYFTLLKEPHDVEGASLQSADL